MATRSATAKSRAKRQTPDRKVSAKPRPRRVTNAHKAAMAQGRQQGAVIRRYLQALQVSAAPRRRGRPRTPATIDQRLNAIKADLEATNVDPLKQIRLIQERLDLTTERDRLTNATDPTTFEDAFVKAVGPYSERKGITYRAWRELGVPKAVLQRAGLHR